MEQKKILKIHNKSDKPDNIVFKENGLIEKCINIENNLPRFMKDYFIYLKGSIATSSRLAYLEDIQFFCNYLVETKELTNASNLCDITLDEFNNIKARDVNLFLGDYCSRYYKNTDKNTLIFENNNRSLARKKSSLSTLFKFLYRNEQLDNNITDGFNPIKLPKPQPDAIKRLEIDEVAKMLESVELGTGLTDREKIYWRKTKLRDKAFYFSRGVFKIYRIRGKEVLMPINQTCEIVVRDYVENERPQSELLADEYKDALFLSLQNKRMDSKAIRQLVKKYTSISMDTSRDNGYSPHKLRATAATSLIQNGFSIYDVQNLLDHDNVTTTQLYAAHKKNVKRDIVNNFEWIDEDYK